MEQYVQIALAVVSVVVAVERAWALIERVTKRPGTK